MNMFSQDTIEVRRDFDALLIPSGIKIQIKKGSFRAVEYRSTKVPRL